MPILKDGSLVINAQDFLQGQADSPYVGGLGNVRNIELFKVPGVAQVQWAPNLYLSTTALPMAVLKDTHGNVYVITQGAGIYKNGVLVTGTNSRLYSDAKIANDYLICTIRNGDYVEVYGPLSLYTPLYTTTWKTLPATTGASYEHPIIIGQDNIIYIGNGKDVVSLQNFVAGDAVTAPTATINTSALDLPAGEQIRCMAQLGQYLILGTAQGSTFFDFKYGSGTVYFWDRSSPSFDTGPLYFVEDGIQQMITIGTSLYVVAGVYGNIYSTNKTSFLPMHRINYNQQHASTAIFYPNAIAKIGDEVVIGSSTLTDSYPGTVSQHGVWGMKMQPSMYGGLSFSNPFLRNTISTGNFGNTQPLSISAILPISGSSEKAMYIGWQDGSNYGVDVIDNGCNAYSNFQAIMESQLYEVGDTLRTKSYQTLRFKLAAPLITNQSIRIKYRKDMDAAWTTIGTFTKSDLSSGSTEYIGNALISDAINLQLRIELSQTNIQPTSSNVRFKELILA